ncbi:MAG: 4Fe-4S binding protein [Desulfobacterales bacterium]|nr:4Fe-4S binding protein [Desulfobacterales bacterium]
MDIRIKKTWPVASIGRPSSIIRNLSTPSIVALAPEYIPFFFPRLLVKTGDHVEIGTPILEDKKKSYIKFLSPAGGSITSINYGPRRMIREIIISVEPMERHVKFSILDINCLAKINEKDLADHLIDGGVWPYIRELPFRKIADPFKKPPSIWVHLDSADSYQPGSEIYLKDSMIFFELGLAALKKLCEAVYVCQHSFFHHKDSAINSYVTHKISGGYPSTDPGVILYHTKKTSADNRSWYISGQDVLMIGLFLANGVYPTKRIVTVSKPNENSAICIKTRIGAPLSYLIDEDMTVSVCRWFSGGLFSGRTSSKDSFLGFYDTSVAVLPASLNKEFFGFLRPGYDKFSMSRAFLSVLNRSAQPQNNDMHGEARACINCGTCAKVCPVDILPQFMYKSICAEEIEEALQHGLLDCVECGLCSFACPSKIELSDSFISARQEYCLEQG